MFGDVVVGSFYAGERKGKIRKGEEKKRGKVSFWRRPLCGSSLVSSAIKQAKARRRRKQSKAKQSQQEAAFSGLAGKIKQMDVARRAAVARERCDGIQRPAVDGWMDGCSGLPEVTKQTCLQLAAVTVTCHSQ